MRRQKRGTLRRERAGEERWRRWRPKTMNRKNLTEKQSQKQRRTDGERSRQRQKEERQSLSRRDKNRGKSQRSRAVKQSDRDIKKERRQITLFLAISHLFTFWIP